MSNKEYAIELIVRLMVIIGIVWLSYNVFSEIVNTFNEIHEIHKIVVKKEKL